jgi:hypothetical protein
MLTHTNSNVLFLFLLYLYSRWKNAKTVKSQNEKTTLITTTKNLLILKEICS